MEPTERRAIGSTGVSATVFGFGTAPIGGLYDEVTPAQAAATVERAWDAGIRYYDSAPLYGYGMSEERLGAALAGKPRADIVVATKVGRLIEPVPPDARGDAQFKGAPRARLHFDFSRDGVMRSFEWSLERLGLDRIDVLQVHDPDDFFDDALRHAFPTLMELRSQGVISAVGCGMNQGSMLTRFVRELDIDCVLLAGRYTLLEQGGLDELLPACVDRHVAVIIGGVFNSGLLADPKPGAPYNYVPAPADVFERAARIAAVCARHDVPIAAAAIQFPLAHPAVVTVIPGMRSPAEVEANERLLRAEIPSYLWTELKAEGLLRDDAPTP